MSIHLPWRARRDPASDQEAGVRRNPASNVAASGQRNPASDSNDGVRAGSSYVEILTHEQVTALVAELIDVERDYVVVGVTSIPHENVPSIDVDTLRLILPPDTRVYFIPSGSLTFRLMSLLPDRRAPYNGAARLWLPGGDWESDQFRHPQVYDDTNQYGFRAIREIAYKLRHALTKSGLAIDFDPVEAYRGLESTQARTDLEQLRTAVARATEERDLALRRLRVSEHREREAQRELALLRARVLGPLTTETAATRRPAGADPEAAPAPERA
jgi:hypothetical protein